MIIICLTAASKRAFDLCKCWHQLQGKATWMVVAENDAVPRELAWPSCLYALKERGLSVPDLKFHDIPHQVEGQAFIAAAGSGSRYAGPSPCTLPGGGVDTMAALAAAQKGAFS